MTRVLFALALAGALVSIACAPPRYVVTPVHGEGVKNVIDGEWFTREIWAKNRKLSAVELVYCPIQPAQPTVCRTTVVWKADASHLVNAVRKSTAQDF